MTILDATNLLKAGYILQASDGQNQLSFMFEKPKIKVISDKYNLTISISQFYELYKDLDFFLIKDKEVNNGIDEIKDLEYYSKLQKIQ